MPQRATMQRAGSGGENVLSEDKNTEIEKINKAVILDYIDLEKKREERCTQVQTLRNIQQEQKAK